MLGVNNKNKELSSCGGGRGKDRGLWRSFGGLWQLVHVPGQPLSRKETGDLTERSDFSKGAFFKKKVGLKTSAC